MAEKSGDDAYAARGFSLLLFMVRDHHGLESRVKEDWARWASKQQSADQANSASGEMRHTI